MNWSRVYVRYCMGHKGIPSVSSRWATSSRPLSSNRKFGMNDRKERGALIQVELCGFFHSKRGFRRPKEGAAAWRLPGVLRTPIGRSGGRPPPPERRVRHSCLTRGGPPPLFPNGGRRARKKQWRERSQAHTPNSTLHHPHATPHNYFTTAVLLPAAFLVIYIYIVYPQFSHHSYRLVAGW